MKKDGNSKNGYHNVKCQVPETEELERTEKRNRNRKRAQREKKDLLTTQGKRKKRMRHLHFHILCILFIIQQLSGPVICFR